MEDFGVVRVLFVCLGNICRSPTAEGVFRKMVEQEGLGHLIRIDSAGTSDYHAGGPPDPRALQAARQRGIDLSGLRARQAVARDFTEFDYVLAMDGANLRDLRRLCPPDYAGHFGRFLDFAPQLKTRDVPDPYYGGANGFETVLDMIEAASRGLLSHIRETHLQESA